MAIQSYISISIVVYILTEIQGDIHVIQHELYNGTNLTLTLNNTEIVIINYHLRSNSTFSTDYELPPDYESTPHYL